MTKEEYEKEKKIVPKISYFKSLCIRLFVIIIIFFSLLIFVNNNESAEKTVKKYLFSNTFKFSKINSWYNNLFLNKRDDKPVANTNSINYSNAVEYNNGVVLTIGTKTPVYLLSSGIVVYIGQKEEYGNTIIVQQSNGVDAWYGNIEDVNVKLYDYVEKDTIIASASNTLYLLFDKEGEYLNYKEFIN